MSETSRDIAGGSALAALHEAVQGVAWQTDLRTTLSLIAEKARGLSCAASTAIMLLDPTRTLLDFAAVSGVNAVEILGQKVHVDDTLAGKTALYGELYLTYTPSESLPPISGFSAEQSAIGGVRSAAVVPLFFAGHPVGALAALNREDGQAFSGEDILFLQTLANIAALAINIDHLRQAAARKQRERDILFQAARTTSSSLNVQDVLSSVLATLEESIDLSCSAVYLLNDERTRLYISSERGLNPEESDLQLEADQGLAAQVLASSKAMIFPEIVHPDVEGDPLLPGMRSVLAAPMLSRSMPEGLIAIGSRQADAYIAEDADLLTAVASQAAIALENAWLYEDAMRRAQEATALYELSQAIGSTLSLGRMLNFVADRAISLLHVDKFALFLWNPHTEFLEIKIARNLSAHAVHRMRPRRGEGIAGWVLEFETPTAVQDVSADHRNRSCSLDAEGVTSVVCVPLQSADQVIGVMLAMSSRRRLFTVGEMELLYTISNQVGAAISNAQMFEEARQKKDELRKYVRRVARALGSSTDARGAAQVIVDLAVEMTGADRIALLSVAPDGDLLIRGAYNLRGARIMDSATASEGESPAAWVARRGRSLMIEDFSKDRFALPAYAAKEKISSYLGVPLKLGKTTLGVLEVYTRESRHFTSDEIRLLLTVASQAAVALQNALLVEQAGRRVSDLQFLSRFSDLVQALSNTEELLTAVLPLLANTLGAERGSLEWSEAVKPYFYRCTSETLGQEDQGRPQFPLFLPFTNSQNKKGKLTLFRSTRFDSHEQRLAETTLKLLSLRL